MTQNPYAQPPGFETNMPVAARTSVAAILSLVCALLCPIPGLSILAIILGIAALFMIGSSQGRVSGKGLAISGIFIGLLVTLLWGGLLIGARQIGNMIGQQFMGNATSFFQAVEAKNYAQAKTVLNLPTGAAGPTDADFDAFLQAYQAEVGSFQSMPKGMMELFGSFRKLQQFNYQPTPGSSELPIISEFAKGPAIVLLGLPQGVQAGGNPNPNAVPIQNIGVRSINGTVIWLIPKTGGTPPAPSPSPGSPTTPPPAGNGG